MARGRLPRVIRIGRATYTRCPRTRTIPQPNLFTPMEIELMTTALELLKSSGLVDAGPQETVDELLEEFRHYHEA